jgi:sterol desaturase/sphingolipid hydroxylase (fatty acid hydroxylase superfamily)
MASVSSGSRRAVTGASADARGASTAFTRAEVAARAAAGASVLVVDGDVIDFGGFAHPGGHAILRRHAGEDVSAVFRGKQAGEGRRYAHSDAATRTLRRLRVGTIETVEATENDDEPHSRSVVAPTKPSATKPTKPAARESSPVAASFEREPAIGWRLNGTDHEHERETDRAPSSVGSDDEPPPPRDAETRRGDDGAFANGQTAKQSNSLTKSRRKEDTETTTADLCLPLFEQVGALGARGAYAAWVYEPESRGAAARSNKGREPLRFFESATLEFFSKSPWYLVPATWVPVALASLVDGWGRLARSASDGDGLGFRDGNGNGDGDGWIASDGGAFFLPVALLLATAAFAAGAVLWSAMEYAFHRFVFHHVPRGRAGAQAHFLAHGCHHKAPADTLRLTFPPAAAAPVIFLSRAAFFSLAEVRVRRGSAACGESVTTKDAATHRARGVASFLFAGCLLGYVAYDCTHFALHAVDGSTLRKVDRRLGTRLERKKAAHLRHHFVDHARAFGISSERWDRALGTEHVGRR